MTWAPRSMMSATVHSMNAVTAPTILDGARMRRFHDASGRRRDRFLALIGVVAALRIQPSGRTAMADAAA
jgi:hypothetical protein